MSQGSGPSKSNPPASKTAVKWARPLKPHHVIPVQSCRALWLMYALVLRGLPPALAALISMVSRKYCRRDHICAQIQISLCKQYTTDCWPNFSIPARSDHQSTSSSLCFGLSLQCHEQHTTNLQMQSVINVTTCTGSTSRLTIRIPGQAIAMRKIK